MTKKLIKEVALTLLRKKATMGRRFRKSRKLLELRHHRYMPILHQRGPFLEVYQDSIQMELTELGRVAEREDLVGEEKLQSIFFVATDFSSNPDEKKFFQRAVFYPPKSLFQELKEETKTYEQLTNRILRETLEK